jgi:hypothetical protein
MEARIYAAYTVGSMSPPGPVGVFLARGAGSSVRVDVYDRVSLDKLKVTASKIDQAKELKNNVKAFFTL